MVDKDGIQWNDLADLITDYVFDLQHGMNSNPDPYITEGNAIITRGNLESYYQYIHTSKMPNYIIPEWAGYFRIYMLEKASNGAFIPRTAYLDSNRKLNFSIEASMDLKSPDEFRNTMVHELQHAYSHWIQLYKNIRFRDSRKNNMYMHAVKGFGDEKYGGKYHPMSIQKFPDLIEINEEIFENPLYLERTLLTGFYYADVDEIRSFIQEYANDMMQKIKNNIKEVKNDIEDAKFNYNNVLDTLSINYYDSKYYKIYKSYLTFYKKLEKKQIDEDVAVQAIKGAAQAIKICLDIPPTKKLIQFSGDEERILREVARKQIPVYEGVLKKMHKIFVKLIMEIQVK